MVAAAGGDPAVEVTDLDLDFVGPLGWQPNVINMEAAHFAIPALIVGRLNRRFRWLEAPGRPVGVKQTHRLEACRNPVVPLLAGRDGGVEVARENDGSIIGDVSHPVDGAVDLSFIATGARESWRVQANECERPWSADAHRQGPPRSRPGSLVQL